MSLEVFEQIESEVRGYVRNFPVVFDRAEGVYLYAVDETPYLDFFSGASVLNYGHNHPELRQPLLDYIAAGRITHSLDMASRAKEMFLREFKARILEPRGLPHKVQFPGPTGTNSVEAALKLARKVKGREKIMSFTNAFHGMTLGSLSVTGNAFKRSGAGLPLTHSDSMPFCHYFGDDFDTIEYIDRLLADQGSGVDLPAAAIVETVQAEGGINVADFDWLRRLEALCRQHDMLLILDDIQMGCGRTGKFFSFEDAGINPDIICLSKSISGYGLPLALTLVKPEYDIWEPGEHNGTFRGHNLAFVTATKALQLFWCDDQLSQEVDRKGRLINDHLQGLARRYPELKADVRGRGMMQGIAFANADMAGTVSKRAFQHQLIVETSGPEGEVLKLMPPLTIDEADLSKGLAIVDQALAEAVAVHGGDSMPVRAIFD
ncbi:diaminobutyrate--2-oxoglutarate transaminase [Alkalilimnicola ehrlichii]|uniref:Diaminobutyrate--2-oxoglutarate transaminase n=1 Tax=Alkalilimnicola ehrlichii TaxID=351052 RepID=A0A3E0WVX1_9GAMM|nr:diaminobutyrate--2-oxoglutarate transaminase [Alkalilimnicola ehrlichii]RFA29164.1 diaminobutyrate--2-oxoglutarate transaminase [Alkalilimnicola ehrlichii]RFA36077.1 diaminobutyrate--2-oxoglutarate transaminase [Alkalilimnicola ehrlichii]